jgi:anti-anti-sigma factor
VSPIGPAFRSSVEAGPVGTTVLRLAGELDFSAARGFGSVLRDAFAACEARLVIDCTELDFLDSSGLRELLGLLPLSGGDACKVVLRNVRGQPLDVLEVSGTVALFQMEESFDSG